MFFFFFYLHIYSLWVWYCTALGFVDAGRTHFHEATHHRSCFRDASAAQIAVLVRRGSVRFRVLSITIHHRCLAVERPRHIAGFQAAGAEEIRTWYVRLPHSSFPHRHTALSASIKTLYFSLLQ